MRITASPKMHVDLTAARRWRGAIDGDHAKDTAIESSLGLRALVLWDRSPASDSGLVVRCKVHGLRRRPRNHRPLAIEY
jgi:hypothetical protein